MVKKLKKQVPDFIGAGIGLGAGSLAVSGIGGSTAASAGKGLVAFGKFMPVMGTTMGGGAVLRSMSLLKPPKQKKFRL